MRVRFPFIIAGIAVALMGAFIGGAFLSAALNGSASSQNKEVPFAAINIIDTHLFPLLYSNWTVRFTTAGTGNLTISARNATTYAEFLVDDSQTTQDLEIIELRCNEEILFNKYDSVYAEDFYILLKNKSVVKPAEIETNSLSIEGILVENYHCAGVGYWTVKELTAGTHYQQFDFLGELGYAENLVNESIEFTTVTDGTTPTIYKLNSSYELQVFFNSTINGIQLNRSNINGTYVSQIFDAGSSVTWLNLSWVGSAFGDIPNYKATENYFGNSGANMSGNVLLMHLNNNSAIGENNSLVVDTSGEKHNATCDLANSKCPSLAAGMFGNALNFDGTDFISIPNTGTINITNANITVSAWLNGGAQETYDYIISADDGNGNKGWALYTGAQAEIRFWVAVGGVAYVTSNGGNIWNSAWHHVVGTYNGSDVALFVDGDLKSANPIVSGTITSGYSSVVIGGSAITAYYTGRIDEISVWNRTLSGKEVTDLYRRGLTRLNVSVRSCDDAACSGETFTVAKNNASPVDLSTLNIADNQYFQYNFTLFRDNYAFSPQLFNVTLEYSGSSCSYSSGNWLVDAADNCVISSNVDLGGNDIIITGTGTFDLSAQLNNFGKFVVHGAGANVVCRNTGGCFG